MRPAFPASALFVPLFVPFLLLTPPPLPAQASLLPQIEAARELEAIRGAEPPTLTKHYVEVAPGERVAVHGAKERRQVRFARWVDSLSGDRLAVYQAEGFPRHRLLSNTGGVRTETWRYPDGGRLYVFRDGTLIEARSN